MNTFINRIIPAVALVEIATASADAQVVYYSAMRPVAVAPVIAAPMMQPAYVANYTPAGNYAAVTAYSPPVMAAPTAVAVTSSYAPAVAPMAVTSYYAPATVAYSPVVAAPVMAYYAPTAVVAPVYRRGLFGGLRPVRNAYYIGY